MLTRKDIDNLFELIAIYRKNDPHLNDNSLRAAWHLSLSPYDKDDVRRAVGDWFRQCNYWPDVSEIAKLCPPLPENKSKISPKEAAEIREDLQRVKQLYMQICEAKSGYD